jgi:hypothetical protein
MNDSPETKRRWNEDAFRDGASPYDPREEVTFDPAKYLFDGIKNNFFGAFFDSPPSYFLYATDVEYRQKLNLKIAVLREQIEELQKELRRKGIDYRPT